MFELPENERERESAEQICYHSSLDPCLFRALWMSSRSWLFIKLPLNTVSKRRLTSLSQQLLLCFSSRDLSANSSDWDLSNDEDLSSVDDGEESGGRSSPTPSILRQITAARGPNHYRRSPSISFADTDEVCTQGSKTFQALDICNWWMNQGWWRAFPIFLVKEIWYFCWCLNKERKRDSYGGICR